MKQFLDKTFQTLAVLNSKNERVFPQLRCDFKGAILRARFAATPMFDTKFAANRRINLRPPNNSNYLLTRTDRSYLTAFTAAEQNIITAFG